MAAASSCTAGLFAGGSGLPGGTRRGPAPNAAGSAGLGSWARARARARARSPRFAATPRAVGVMTATTTTTTRWGAVTSSGTGPGQHRRRRFSPRSAAADVPGEYDGDDENTHENTPIGPITEDEDGQAKGLPGAIKGGGVLLRVVAFSLAGVVATQQGTPAAAAAMAAATNLTGTPLQWFGGSFLAAAVASSALLRVLQRRGAFQPVRADGPKSHTTGAKPATPTMGGAAFIPAGALAALAFTRFSHPTVVGAVQVDESSLPEA